MKITAENKELISLKNIRIHDGELGELCYNYMQKSCFFEILNPTWNIKQTFHIKGILYLEVQSCEFWGPGPNTNFCKYDENEPRLKELLNKQASSEQHRSSLLANGYEQYFEHIYQFISGDEIRFICEEVEFEEYEYHKE